MRRLGFLLCLVLVARAGDDDVVHFYDLADLRAEGGDAWWAIVVSRVRAAAGEANVALKEKTIVVRAPKATQERVAQEVVAVRSAFDKFVTLEVRVARIEGGAGVASVPAEKLAAFLKERNAQERARPTITCRNGVGASLEVFNEISYVSDFTLALDAAGGVTADPVVSTLKDGIFAKLRPIAGAQGVRVVAEVTVTDVATPWPEVELPYPGTNPLKVQVPESATWSVTRFVECGRGAYAALDIGGPWVLFLRAIESKAPKGNMEGKAIELQPK